MKKRLDRDIFIYLCNKYCEEKPKPSWWVKISSLHLDQNPVGQFPQLVVGATRASLTSHRQFTRPGDTLVGSIYTLLHHIVKLHSIHQQKVNESWIFWRELPENFGIEGEEPAVLLAYQAAQIIIEYPYQCGSADEKSELEVLSYRFGESGVTRTWISSLAPQNLGQVQGTPSWII